MIRLHSLKMPLDYTKKELRQAAARKLHISPDKIKCCTLSRKSIDARKKSDIVFAVSVDIELASSADESRCLKGMPENEACRVEPWQPPQIPRQKCRMPRPVIIGFGPAGIFAALWLAEAGLRPLVLERGRDAQQRTLDVEAYFSKGASAFSPVSNVQFGEGGAGTFSDGKLNSGIKDARAMTVLRTLVKYGAPQEIVYDAKPHIGTDLLAGCIIRIREHIISLGGEVRFESRVTAVHHSDGKVTGVTYEHAGQLHGVETDTVVLAIGHSARDTFESLLNDRFTLIP